MTMVLVLMGLRRRRAVHTSDLTLLSSPATLELRACSVGAACCAVQAPRCCAVAACNV